MRFVILISKADEGGYVATIPDLPGVKVKGANADEARQFLREYIRDLGELLAAQYAQRGERIEPRTTSEYMDLEIPPPPPPPTPLVGVTEVRVQLQLSWNCRDVSVTDPAQIQRLCAFFEFARRRAVDWSYGGWMWAVRLNFLRGDTQLTEIIMDDRFYRWRERSWEERTLPGGFRETLEVAVGGFREGPE